MKIIANNKKAFHEFFVSNLTEAGISLQGDEVKSVRQGKVSLIDSFVSIKDGQAILKNLYIAPYEKSSVKEHETRRSRKLLLHKAEIAKLEKASMEKGFSIVPTKVYIKKGLVKIEIALAKGKKLYDKREVLKEKAIKRDLDRAVKLR